MTRKDQRTLTTAGAASLGYLTLTDDPAGVLEVLGDQAELVWYASLAALAYGLSGSIAATAIVVGGVWWYGEQETSSTGGTVGGYPAEPCDQWGGGCGSDAWEGVPA